jgi:HD-GYP domain-containing protein (c-di-GMP phosphodiesterase class II)
MKRVTQFLRKKTKIGNQLIMSKNLIEWFNKKANELPALLEIKQKVLSENVLVLSGDKGGKVVLVTSKEGIRHDNRTEILILLGEKGFPEKEFFAICQTSIAPKQLQSTIQYAIKYDFLSDNNELSQKNLRRKEYELKELIEIGKRLNSYQSLDSLLSVILEKSRHIMGADAGSIYIVEGDSDNIEDKQLHFKLVQNDSMLCKADEFTMPVKISSIAGAAVIMKRSINIPNAQSIPEEASFKYDPSFDKLTGYKTISILAVPMINQEGDVMGVIQLLNKKKNPSMKLVTPMDFEKEVIPMDEHSIDLIETLASQAGIAMENTRLYEEIHRIFAGFVEASVHAIEQRDPTTSGHSFRVAALTKELARVVSEQKSGQFKDVVFTEFDMEEIETAALLHDFGKVGVREEILVKAKKLYPKNLEVIQSRIDFIRTSIFNDHLQRRLSMHEEGAPKEELSILDEAKARSIAEIDECWRIINTANEPTVLAEGDFAKVEDVGSRTFFDINGKKRYYLEKEELSALLVAKGSLTSEELEEIRSHATHTISFLERIPWGKKLKNIPKYAGCHHEKLDGSGYPKGLKSKDIPLPSKIMAIADIYDALTAADRPYKKAVPLEKALDILNFEAKDGYIDTNLLELFKKNEVYKVLENVTFD